jgi:hypothetical protein
MHAQNAHDLAKATAATIGDPELEQCIADLGKAILGWSPADCDNPSRREMYRQLSLEAAKRCRP